MKLLPTVRLAALAAVLLIVPSAMADEPAPAICGGIQGLACGAAEFCEFPVEARCGAADRTGLCEPKPVSCGYDGWQVCGCDGKTYPNDCERRAAGIAKVSDGECKPSG